MEPVYMTGEELKHLTTLQRGEYEQCSFTACTLQGADLRGSTFIDCHFSQCDLSMAKITRTAFQDVRFSDCKLLGMQFGDCNPFNISLAFDGCMMDHASFNKLKLAKTVFNNCRLDGADFTDTDLSGAALHQCDLLSAIFDNTNLRNADLSTAYRYTIDPERNQLKGARFSCEGISGLLEKYGIVVEG